MIAVFGAGAIGCWVGGALAAGGAEVTLIGRPRLMAELSGGLTVTDLERPPRTVRVRTATDASAAAGASMVLVTVKSGQTQEAAEALAPLGNGKGAVVSLQNGVRNALRLREALPGRRVLAGMVPFNVVRRGPATYHRASGGPLYVEDDGACLGLLDACWAAGLPVRTRRDMAAVQWTKLVMNLNNAVNALSGLPLAVELSQAPFRRCLAALQDEALRVLAAAEQPLARLTAVPPTWQPRLLRLPDALFRHLLPRVVPIDPHARSSMWDDLEAGRATEIDYLQGEVVELARRLGRTAPVNARTVELVRAAEAGGRRDWSGAELERELGLLRGRGGA